MASTFLIKNVRLFDGHKVHAGPQSVFIGDGVIQSISNEPPEGLSQDTVVIDGNGRTLLPGLIDAHTHVFRGVEELKTAFRNGVTTVFDMHNVPENAFYVKKLAQESDDMPQVFTALHAATVAGGWPRTIVRHTNTDPVVLASLDDYPCLSTPEEGRAYVARNKSMGADFIKLMQESGDCLTMSVSALPAPSKELQAAIIDAAHGHGLLTFAHATSYRETLLVLKAGTDAMAHQFFDRPYDDQILDAYRKNNAFLVPTLTAISSMMGLDTARNWVSNQAEGARFPAAARHCMCDCMNISQPGCRIEFAYEGIKALKSNGIDVICGTDSGPSIHGTAIGPAVHLEMYLYVSKCNFTPVEALQSATGLSARRLQLHDRGHIAVGKRADLLLVHGDPTHDIECTVNIERVWKRGIAQRECVKPICNFPTA